MVKIYSHAGYQKEGKFPKNSIQAFEATLTYGADGFEFDVQLSKDRQLVCYHDFSLEKVGIQRNVRDLRFVELIEIELTKGIRLPSLAEVLEKFGQKTFLNILKTGLLS